MTWIDELRLSGLALLGLALAALDYNLGGIMTAHVLRWATWPVWWFFQWRLR